MQRRTLFNLWLAITAAVSFIYLLAGYRGALAGVLVAGAAAGAFALYTHFTWRWLARYLRRMEDYAARLPSNKIRLPEILPDELAMLGAALKRTSQHVNSIIERSNLELARRETILAAMTEGVLAVDRSLHVTFANEAFTEAFQTRKPVPEGRPLFEVVREPLLRDVLEEVLDSGAPSSNRVRLPSAGGKWFQIHVRALGPVPAAGAIAVLHDVTDLQRQEQARKDFVANVSHELRTPLAAIRGYAETLLDGALEDAGVNRKFVEVIQSHAIRLNNIAQDLLILSELDSRPGPEPATGVPVHELFDSVVRTVEGAAKSRGITISVLSCDNVVAQGNRLRLEQIFLNLVDNAVKFNHPSGSVTIECRPSADLVEVVISDTGIGIPSEDLGRIFERFYRVDRARSREAGGTGLGLSIVRESLERMGGSISVESQLGQGTRFFVRLPSAASVIKL
ncbi:MAG TPA: ATP-binding protein [Bryobacteraceae bacterium]|jgi:two-component system phosphate regulon sensor histidine kinase PhoR